MASLPATQKAIVLTGKRTPNAEIDAPVYPPAAGEITVRVEWTAATPLDLHRADGGLLIPSYPSQTGGGGVAGTVVAVGSGDVNGLAVGDRVMSFCFPGNKEANWQQYVTVPVYLASRVPDCLTLQEACTVPVNLVTVFHTANADLELELPWPIPQDWTPKAAQAPILVWGAGSSVGIYAVQVLRHWGYRQILAVASGRNHEYLKRIGATACFDYSKPDVVDSILSYSRSLGRAEPAVPYILDCIGSIDGTLLPLTKIAQRGSRVAVMLPVILKDATEEEEPEYEMDVSKCHVGKWADGVILRGARTLFYLQNEFFKNKLQPEIVPALLEQRVVEPNKQRVVEGATLLERTHNALDLLRARAVSAERLVFKVSS